MYLEACLLSAPPAMNEHVFHCLPMTRLIQGQWERLFPKMLRFVVDRLTLLQGMVRDGSMWLDVRQGLISPENKALLQEIKGLDPYTIDWSNLVDYTHPKVFHVMAQACSSDETIHYAHSMNWLQRVVGAMILDYQSDKRRDMLRMMREGWRDVLEAMGGEYLAQDSYCHPYNLSVNFLKGAMFDSWLKAFILNCDMPLGKADDLSYMRAPAIMLMIFCHAASEMHFSWNYAGIPMQAGLTF